MKCRWALMIAVIAVLALTGCAADIGGGATGGNGSGSPVQKPATPPKTAVEDTVPVKVYFGTHDAKYIVAETHKLKNDAALMKRAMEALVAGPTSPDLVSVLPKATQVRSVAVIDKTAYVDFSREIAKRGFAGSATEILAVGAIVNTLTEFPEVEKVQILVEGRRVSTLFGHLDVYDPLSRSPGLIRGK